LGDVAAKLASIPKQTQSGQGNTAFRPQRRPPWLQLILLTAAGYLLISPVLRSFESDGCGHEAASPNVETILVPPSSSFDHVDSALDDADGAPSSQIAPLIPRTGTVAKTAVPKVDNYTDRDLASDTCEIASKASDALSPTKERWRAYWDKHIDEGLFISNLISYKEKGELRTWDAGEYEEVTRIHFLKDIAIDEQTLKELGRLPRTLSYYNKARSGFEEVPPAVYLFNPRGVSLVESEGKISFNDAYSFMVFLRFESLSFCKYEAIERLMIEVSGSQQRTKGAVFTLIDMIRDPSPAEEEHLIHLAGIAPKHLVDSVLRTYDADAAKARKLISKRPNLYCGFSSWLATQPGSFSTGRAKNYRDPLKISRLDDGELMIFGCAGDHAVFRPELEFSTSPLAKFLFRRGTKFVHSASRLVARFRRDYRRP
jgi:hypothetical protein